jgi:hypothetical protein
MPDLRIGGNFSGQYDSYHQRAPGQSGATSAQTTNRSSSGSFQLIDLVANIQRTGQRPVTLQFNMANRSSTEIDYETLGWESTLTQDIPQGTRFNHANFSGTLNGTGQSGYTGMAIWMTSADHVDSAKGYAGQSGRYFVLEAKVPLKLAILDELGNQVFPDELPAWMAAAMKHGLDGVKTAYGNFDEVVLFDRTNVTRVSTKTI